MNKKRFKYEYGLIWNENGEKFDVNECEGRRLVCDKLNEQQEHITHLEDTNDNFRIKLIEDIEAMEQAEKKIGEQQATIEAKNEYQRTLEAKIRRLKDRIKVLEKNE